MLILYYYDQKFMHFERDAILLEVMMFRGSRYALRDTGGHRPPENFLFYGRRPGEKFDLIAEIHFWGA